MLFINRKIDEDIDFYDSNDKFVMTIRVANLTRSQVQLLVVARKDEIKVRRASRSRNELSKIIDRMKRPSNESSASIIEKIKGVMSGK